jgi:hypothetical protein
MLPAFSTHFSGFSNYFNFSKSHSEHMLFALAAAGYGEELF